MSDKSIANIEERLTAKAVAELAKALTEATEGYAKAFSRYMGFNVQGEKGFDIRAKVFNAAFGKIVADTVTLRLGYYAGYLTRLDTTCAVNLETFLTNQLPKEVIDAIRGVACADFLAKVEEIGEIATGASEAIDNIHRS
jgi:hypothetical protein